MRGYGVLVVWQDGRQAYLRKEPSGDRMEFVSTLRREVDDHEPRIRVIEKDRPR